MAAVHRCMMLEAILTNNVHQRRKSRYSNHCARSKGIQWIIGKFSLAYISSNLTVEIVGADSAEGQRPLACATLHRAKCVLLSESRSKDMSGGDPHLRQKVFCPVAAMKQNAFLRIVTVVVIPVDQRARASTCELQSIHAHNPCNIDFS